MRQDASELEEAVYDNRHTKEMNRHTATVSNVARVGLVNIPVLRNKFIRTHTRQKILNIPEEEMTAGVRITGGCNATIKLQVIGGGKQKERRISSDEEETLSIG